MPRNLEVDPELFAIVGEIAVNSGKQLDHFSKILKVYRQVVRSMDDVQQFQDSIDELQASLTKFSKIIKRLEQEPWESDKKP